MLPRPSLSRYLASLEATGVGTTEAETTEADTVMVGLPFDGTCSFRPGARFGPAALRDVSFGIETYSPYLDRDLEDIRFADLGDLDLPIGNREKVLAEIEAFARAHSDRKILGIGGEHLVSYPLMKVMAERHPDLQIVQFDAHCDLREDYLGEVYSHATVMRLIANHVGPSNLHQLGIRSGTREEFQYARQHGTLVPARQADVEALRPRLEGKPVYLTIDLDVLDPSIFPGTGTPEPGGITFDVLMALLKRLDGLNLVGADLVELSPHYDASGVSSLVAAKVAREVLLMMSPLRGPAGTAERLSEVSRA